jgi:hypothetical protein
MTMDTTDSDSASGAGILFFSAHHFMISKKVKWSNHVITICPSEK